MKVERGRWTAKDGTVNEQIFIRDVLSRRIELGFSFSDLRHEHPD
jgi:hypothetical protein